MASYLITKVHKEPVHATHTHQHIEKVELADGTRLTRQQVINRINAGDRFYTQYAGQTAWVYVRHCPTCYTREQITTTPDGTVGNNLDRLPTF